MALAVVSALSIWYVVEHWRAAFPQASLSLRYSKSEITAQAADFLSSQGLATAGFRWYLNTTNTQDGLIIFEQGNGASGMRAKSSLPVDFNQWNLLAVAVDRAAGQVRIYKNGEDVTHPAYGAALTNFTASGPWFLGRLGNNTAFFQGQMDELRVWPQTLTGGDIALATSLNPDAPFLPFLRTDLRAAMSNINASVYVRFPFVVANPDVADTLTLRVRYDDGLVVYLNGVEVIRRNAPEGDMAWNSAAAGLRHDGEALVYEEFDLTAARLLLEAGTNLLAIHGLNVAPANADLLLQPELQLRWRLPDPSRQRYCTLPTPGRLNGAGAEVLGARISEVAHTPPEPADAEDLLVTARITATADTVAGVTLTYRIMFNAETNLAMNDAGLNGDRVPGDGLYSALIPAGASTNGQMIRWLITATDASGVVSRWPLYEDAVNSPKYLGTVVKDPTLTNPLPVLHWFVQDTNAAATDAGTKCALFFLGEFYDNIGVNIHGQSSRNFPKKSYDLDFNPGFNFRWAPGQDRVGDVNMLTTYPDKAHMRNVLAYETYRDAGAVYHYVMPVRVQQNAKIYGTTHLVENGDEDLLKRNGLDPNGALYKMYNTFTSTSHTTIGAQQAEKKTRRHEGNADLLALFNGVVAQSGAARTAGIFDLVNVPATINFLAARDITADRDGYHKNYYLYRDSDGTGEWQGFVWDVDLSFGRSWTNTLTYWDDTVTWFNDLFRANNNGLFAAMLGTPEIRQMYLRRVKSLQAKLMQPLDTPLEFRRYEKRIDELTALLAPDAALDLAAWGTWGNGASKSTCCIQTQPQAADIIKNQFLPIRRLYMQTNRWLAPNGEMPDQPPNPVILISSLDYNPVSRNQAEEYICLTNPQPVAIDLSGWKLEGGARFTFEPGTVIPSNGVMYLSPDLKAFRARTTGPRGGQGLFVRGQYSGQLSARGETLAIQDEYGRLVTSYAYTGNPSPAQQFLRVTEIMYNPPTLPGDAFPSGEYEYLELMNISPTLTLDLTGVHFTNGVTFSFSGSQVTNLAPGARVLIVKNPTAFTQRYGAGQVIAGAFLGSLDNGGERLRLDDAAGEKILDFTYNNSWYPVTDGAGFSLVIVNAHADWTTWDQKASWRPSGQPAGSPGLTDPGQPFLPVILVNEVRSRSGTGQVDAVELYNPNGFEVNLGGWFLTDNFNQPKKYRLPDGTLISGGGFLVFTEADFNAPQSPTRFAFSAEGEEVYLFSGDAQTNLTGYYHGFDFGPSAADTTFGRHVISTGADHFVAQAAGSLGAPNAGPAVGPVVISEVMYHPPDRIFAVVPYDNQLHEFIELHNPTTNAVRLNDPAQTNAAWRLRDAVDFVFPPGATLPPGGFLLVVSFDPVNDPGALAAFRDYYGLAAETPVFGPYQGKLDNSGESVELVRQETVGEGVAAWVLMDKLRYADAHPWPCGADGEGNSLQRLNTLAYGNDPANWASKTPTPGSATPPQAPGLASIIEQPRDVGARTGDSATLKVVACYYNWLTYQWRRQGVDIPGATNATLTLTNLQAGDSAYYTVAVSNENGVILSRSAWLGVQAPPQISQQPQSQTVLDFTEVTFNVGVEGVPPFQYQWRFNGSPIAGGTNAQLRLASVQVSQAGQYSVVVSNSAGTVTSAVATLIVNVPARVLNFPGELTGTNGYAWQWQAQVSGTAPLSLQWFKDGQPLAGATNAVLAIANVEAQTEGYYHLTASNAFGFAASPPARFVVLFRPAIVKNPSNHFAIVGETISLRVVCEGTPPFGYRWRRNNIEIIPFSLGRDTLTFTNIQFTNNGNYDVIITNYANPLGVRSSPAANVTVVQPPPALVEVEEGADVTLSARAAGPGVLKFQWQFASTNLAGATSTNLPLTQVTAEKTGLYLFIITNSVGEFAAYSCQVALAGGPPVITEQPASLALVPGQNAVLSAAASGAQPLLFTWRFNDNLVAGATNSVLQITNATTGHAGLYQLFVTNHHGAATSAVATVYFPGQDSDGDGLPDEWEFANGLNPGLAADAQQDLDGDGLSNLGEFLAGTSPTNKSSTFKIEQIMTPSGANQVLLQFSVISNRSYAVQYQENLAGTGWIRWLEIPARASNQTILLTNHDVGERRFYRLQTPSSP